MTTDTKRAGASPAQYLAQGVPINQDGRWRSAFEVLGRESHAFLLESVEGGERWARYSFLGGDSFAVVTATGGKVWSVVVTSDRGGAYDRMARTAGFSAVSCGGRWLCWTRE